MTKTRSEKMYFFFGISGDPLRKIFNQTRASSKSIHQFHGGELLARRRYITFSKLLKLKVNELWRRTGEQRIRRKYQPPFRTGFVRIVLVIHISVSAEIS
jgi:hypothetical protein